MEQRRTLGGICTGDPTGCQLICISSTSTPSSPNFYAGCPSVHNLPNLSWLGTGTEFAGLHTPWLGY